MGWYRENARDLPWRHTEDPYRIWVSEIMLQQTRVAAVLGYYARFLAVFPTVEALAETDEELLMKLWEGLGYYSRARNLQKAAREITALGGFPDTYDGLLAGLWEFPNVEGTLDETAAGAAVEAMGLSVIDWQSRLTAKHIFTHVEWHMTGYALTVRGDGPAELEWVDAAGLAARSVPSAFARYYEEAKRELEMK